MTHRVKEASFPASIPYGRGLSPLISGFEFYANLLISKCIRMALFATVVNCDLCATPRTVLVAVRLIHEQAVNTELLEGDDVVLGAVQQLLELGLK